MSIFPKFFFTLFGNALPSWLRLYIARVKGDGGTIVDTGHTKEVYADTYPYEPTLIQSCSGGGSTPQNFAVGSEDISNASSSIDSNFYWFISNVTAASISELNPFGVSSGVTLVAEITETGGVTTAKGFYQQPAYQATVVSDQAYTVSAYVKKGGGSLAPDIIQVTHLSTNFGSNFYANYNINTGVVTKVNGGFADIEDVGSGWYRISLAGVATSSGSSGTFVFAFANNDPNAARFPAYTGDDNRDVYIWGVQFVQGNEAGEYIKTTTAAIDSIGTLYSIIPSQSFLLNQFSGAAAGYSLRSLSASRTNVVKVRRSGDNAELNFTATEVSDGTLASWVTAGGGTEDGFVTTWYDQSGNGNNATQATAANQPKIVSAGSLVTENGKAAMDFDGTNDCLLNSTLTASATQSVFYAKKGIIRSGNSAVLGFPVTGVSAQLGIYYWNETPSHYGFNTWSADNWGVSPFTQFTDQTVEFALFKDGNPTTSGVKLFVNGSELSLSQTKGTSDSRTMGNGFRIGTGGQVDTQNYDGLLQEIIVYSFDQSAKRTGIEGNINDYYNIYP